MKNQREIYEALLAGETLVNIDTQMEVALVDDNLSDVRDGIWETEDFTEFKSWEIYVEKKWYENIPDGGVLCRCDDGLIVNIIKKSDSYLFDIKGGGFTFDFVLPLTKQYMQMFMDNAPEEL